MPSPQLKRATFPCLWMLLCTAACGSLPAAEPGAAPAEIPNLLTFWDFQEPAGSDRVSVGEYQYALEERNGPIARVEGGVFGPYSVDFRWGQWFNIDHRDAPGLDLHGQDQQVTVVAWVKRESDRPWQYIAGMWNELDAKRQYALIMSGLWQTDHTTYERSPVTHRAMGYVSPGGGATPGKPFAFDYATGATFIEQNRWYMLAYTFDTEAIKVYVNGELDANDNYNPFLYDEGILDGGEDGSAFTVALRAVPKWPTYPEGVPENRSGFDGRIGGLAVYDRALTAEELARLYQTTMAPRTDQADN